MILGSLLVLCAAIAHLAHPFGAPGLDAAATVAAAAGALALVVIALQRAELEGKIDKTKSAQRLLVRVDAVTQIDPTEVGVDRAEQGILPGGGVPAYVPRAADHALRGAVAGALDGSGPWIIVVHGPSKVGKSRSLFEAVLDYGRTSELELVAPVDGAALKSLLMPGEGLQPGTGAAVLWLDDLEPFLSDGVTWKTLREWHAGAPRPIVAATYGGKGSELIKDLRAGGLATIASEVLGHAREVSLQATTATELTQLRQSLDAGEAASLERHGLAAFLVAGAVLERKLNTGRHAPGDVACPEGVALVYATVDWARCGRTDPITDDSLRRLWSYYLPPGAPVTEECFARALAWALEPVAGSIGLLHRVPAPLNEGHGQLSGADGPYQVFDYVVRLVRDSPCAPPAREEAWKAAVIRATDAQAAAVATSAYNQARKDIAVKTFARARTSPVDEVAAPAGYNLGVLFGELNRSEDAIAVYDDVVARFGDASEPALREHVAGALVNKGVELGVLQRFEEQIAVCDDVVARFGEAGEPALREQVARALVNKGVALGVLRRFEEQIAVCDVVVARFGEAGELALREQVAKALVSKARALAEMQGGIAVPRPVSRPHELLRVSHDGAVRGVAFNSDGTRLATAGDDLSARLIELEGGRELLRIVHPLRHWYSRKLFSVALHPDGERIATAGRDHTARVRDIRNGAELLVITHRLWVRAVRFSPDGEFLATAGSDGTARVWSLSEERAHLTIASDKALNAATFNHDGTLLATAGDDCSACVWDLTATGPDSSAVEPLWCVTHDGAVWAVALSPDGASVATASSDRSARIWRRGEDCELVRLDHDGAVWSVAFSPDGRLVATAGADAHARVWSASDGREILAVEHDDVIFQVTFSPDGRRLATASADQTARVWEL